MRVLAEFNTMMGDDPDRAYYGPNHVLRAAEMGAPTIGFLVMVTVHL